MFETVKRVPGDAILGLIEQYNSDTNPEKVDLGVGVYRDESGQTPILHAVKVAEQHRIDTEQTKAYIGSHGDAEYGRLILETVLGADSTLLTHNRAGATQTPGGSGAVRLAADLVATHCSGRSIWIPEPTWPNHIAMFDAAGVNIRYYPYVDNDNNFDFDAMLAQLEQIPRHDVVLLHACCHNPTGFDPTPDQWERILDVIVGRELLPLVDFAYQGLGQGLDTDAYGVRLLAENLEEMLIAHSCSKNFGIYRERTGSLITIARNEDVMENVRSQLAVAARRIYSMPPAHGSSVVATILNSTELKASWVQELDTMRNRLIDMRKKLVTGLDPYGLSDHYAFVADQRGMFSYTGLNPAQVDQLRDDYSIYMVASGRANVAGLNNDNIAYVCKAIAAVSGNT